METKTEKTSNTIIPEKKQDLVSIVAVLSFHLARFKIILKICVFGVSVWLFLERMNFSR